MIRLLADRHILLDLTPLSQHLEVSLYDPVEGIPANVDQFDALLVRTVTPVNETTLPENPGRLSFIGSATAGLDHVDQPWLEKQGITFANSPGCNAVAVGEYVATSVLIWSLETATQLSGLTAGVVGAGHAGSAAGERLERLGLETVYYDPPREERDPAFRSSTLEEVLSCDLLTFHTPLTNDGPYPTRHWLNHDKLEIHPYKLVINAARGGIIDELALLEAKRGDQVQNYVLDVWENEPLFDDILLANALIRTPHIAGYSLQAKRKASIMVLESLFRHFGIDPPEYYFRGSESPDDSISSEPLFGSGHPASASPSSSTEPSSPTASSSTEPSSPTASSPTESSPDEPPSGAGASSQEGSSAGTEPGSSLTADPSKPSTISAGSDPFGSGTHSGTAGRSGSESRSGRGSDRNISDSFLESSSDGKLLDLLLHLNPIGDYDRLLTGLSGVEPAKKRVEFQKIRSGFPLRQEYAHCLIDPELLERWPVLRSLGLRSINER